MIHTTGQILTFALNYKIFFLNIKTNQMSRPVKEGLDYFPLVVDVYKNTQIRSLMRKKGGSRAFSIFITILCKIYEKGYYIEYSEDFIFDVAEDMHEEKEFVEDVINFCTEVNLIDKDTLKKVMFLLPKESKNNI